MLNAALTLRGCSGSGESDGIGPAGTDLPNTVGASLEDVAATDFEDVLGETMDAAVATEPAPGAAQADGTAVDVSADPPQAPPWWLYLYPLRHRRWDELRLVIGAPAQLAHSVLAHLEEMPDCVAASRSEGCPLSPEVAADACTVSLDLGDSCLIEFQTGGPGQVLELSGSLLHATEVLTASSEPGVWS